MHEQVDERRNNRLFVSMALHYYVRPVPFLFLSILIIIFSRSSCYYAPHIRHITHYDHSQSILWGTSSVTDSSHNQQEYPQHIAFVCDGNSRWANLKNMPTAAGHAAGADRLVQLLEALRERPQVRYCTFYGFSTENWRRPSREIRDILSVMEQTVSNVYDKCLREGMRVRILGDLDDERLPSSLCSSLRSLEKESHRSHTESTQTCNLTLCIAINYGGRQDILTAARRMANAIRCDPELKVTEDHFSSYLSTNGIPDPDLIVRTSGEHRLSNFLLWECAYSELYFTETLWPDFNELCLNDAIRWYSNRTRRFGAREVVTL